MPDAHGNFKPIALSVDAEKWARIFGPKKGQPNSDNKSVKK